MAFEIFCVELPNGRDMLEQLNRFIASHQVVTKQQQLVTRDGIPYMMFCLEYVSGKDGLVDSTPKKDDGWNTLSPEQKEQFEKLRKLRNEIANDEHLEPFVVFTNEQLVEMVMLPSLSNAFSVDIYVRSVPYSPSFPANACSRSAG